MWNPQNIPEKENAPAGNKDISTLNKTYAGSGKASQTKIQSLREKSAYMHIALCVVQQSSPVTERENFNSKEDNGEYFS